MTQRATTALSLHYHIRPGQREAVLAEIKGILDRCAQEPEFITGIVHETPERPNEFVFYDPNSGPHRGRDEIDRIAGKVKATHPDFRYQPISAPEEIGDGGRVRWVSGTPGKPPEYAGTDFIVARDGKIAALYMFFDKLP